MSNKFQINVSEKFPLLKKAPVVEAVFDIRAPQIAWEEKLLKGEIIKALPDYPKVESFRNYETKVKLALKNNKNGDEQEPYVQDIGWEGLILRTQDELNIAHFNRGGFTFSRLAPYLSWEHFYTEALRLWAVYVNISKCSDIGRLGLRFINKIITPTENIDMDKYFREGPQPPKGMNIPFIKFLHHNTLLVEEYQYKINIIKTIQHNQGVDKKGLGIIVDVDVFYEQQFKNKKEIVDIKFNEMRYLKNKTFFGTITDKAIEELK